MKTLGKFSLFIVLLLAAGCEKKRPTPASDPPRGAEEAPERGEPEEGSLETRCFEGDPTACDDLGH